MVKEKPELTLLGGIQGTITRKKETRVKNSVTGRDALNGGDQVFAHSGRYLMGMYVTISPSDTAALTTLRGYEDRLRTKLYA